MKKIQDIVERYMEFGQVKGGLRGFADALNEEIDNKISHVAVANWLTGKNDPATDFLVLLILKYRDWRFDFGLECLAAKDAEVWGRPNGGIWKAGREMATNGEMVEEN